MALWNFRGDNPFRIFHLTSRELLSHSWKLQQLLIRGTFLFFQVTVQGPSLPSWQPAMYVVRNMFHYNPIPKPPLHTPPRTRAQITQSPCVTWMGKISLLRKINLYKNLLSDPWSDHKAYLYDHEDSLKDLIFGTYRYSFPHFFFFFYTLCQKCLFHLGCIWVLVES